MLLASAIAALFQGLNNAFKKFGSAKDMPIAFGQECVPSNMDLLFLLDGSGSVSRTDFNKSLDFVAAMIGLTSLEAGTAQVGVYQFSLYRRKEFGLSDYSTVAEATAAVQSIVQYRSTTDIVKGLNVAIDQGFLNGSSGNLPQHKDVIILLTDGKDDRNATEAIQLLQVASAKAAANDITVFVIGIGSGVATEQLEAAAGDPSRVFTTSTFSDLLSITSQLCEKVVAPTTTTTPGPSTASPGPSTVDPKPEPASCTLVYQETKGKLIIKYGDQGAGLGWKPTKTVAECAAMCSELGDACGGYDSLVNGDLFGCYFKGPAAFQTTDLKCNPVDRWIPTAYVKFCKENLPAAATCTDEYTSTAAKMMVKYGAIGMGAPFDWAYGVEKSVEECKALCDAYGDCCGGFDYLTNGDLKGCYFKDGGHKNLAPSATNLVTNTLNEWIPTAYGKWCNDPDTLKECPKNFVATKGKIIIKYGPAGSIYPWRAGWNLTKCQDECMAKGDACGGFDFMTNGNLFGCYMKDSRGYESTNLVCNTVDAWIPTAYVKYCQENIPVSPPCTRTYALTPERIIVKYGAIGTAVPFAWAYGVGKSVDECQALCDAYGDCCGGFDYLTLGTSKGCYFKDGRHFELEDDGTNFIKQTNEWAPNAYVAWCAEKLGNVTTQACTRVYVPTAGKLIIRYGGMEYPWRPNWDLAACKAECERLGDACWGFDLLTQGNTQGCYLKDGRAKESTALIDQINGWYPVAYTVWCAENAPPVPTCTRVYKKTPGFLIKKYGGVGVGNDWRPGKTVLECEKLCETQGLACGGFDYLTDGKDLIGCYLKDGTMKEYGGVGGVYVWEAGKSVEECKALCLSFGAACGGFDHLVNGNSQGCYLKEGSLMRANGTQLVAPINEWVPTAYVVYCKEDPSM